MSGKTLLKAPKYQYLTILRKNYKYSEMYMNLIIFIIHQLLTILENSYLGSYWALQNGSPLIVYLMDIKTKIISIFYRFC